jgi:hypothetical protein
MLVITEDSDGDYNTQRFIGYRDAGFLQDSLDRAIIQQVSSWVQRHGEGIDNATSSSQGGKCSTDGQCSSCSPAGTALGLTTLPNQGEEAAIDIEKLTNGQDADVPPGPSILVGSVVVWSYVVTNTGNVALTGIIVTDDMGVAVSCPKTTLQPGESMTCTANGIAAACQYSNLGTATGTPEMGPPVTDSDPSHYFGVHHAAIYLEKWANGDDADLPPGPSILAGSSLVWTYVVTNTGDVMLTNVTITDDWGVAVACPKTVLAPGESMTCTGSGTAIAGQYTKVGTATGNPPVGPVVTATDAANYYGCTDYYYDFDRDGHGVGEPRCLSGPEGYYTALMGGDCDDDDSTINPSAVEICGDGLDQDCDGMDRPCLVVGGQVYPINDVQPVELVEPGVVTHETASVMSLKYIA